MCVRGSSVRNNNKHNPLQHLINTEKKSNALWLRADDKSNIFSHCLFVSACLFLLLHVLSCFGRSRGSIGFWFSASLRPRLFVLPRPMKAPPALLAVLPPLLWRLFNESVCLPPGDSHGRGVERAELMVLSQGDVDESLMHSRGTVDLAVFLPRDTCLYLETNTVPPHCSGTRANHLWKVRLIPLKWKEGCAFGEKLYRPFLRCA